MFKKDQRAAVKTRLSIHVESDCSASTEPSAADVTAELNVSPHVLIQSDLNIYTTVSRYRFNYMVNAHVHAYATIQKMWEALTEASMGSRSNRFDARTHLLPVSPEQRTTQGSDIGGDIVLLPM